MTNRVVPHNPASRLHVVGATPGWRRPLGLSVAFALCAACGGDSPSTPAPAATPPAPTPAPPPPAPTVTGVTVLTAPFDPVGYVVGEPIRVQVTFDESVSVSGDPALTLTIGEADASAAYDGERSDGASVVFGYEVRHGDRDADGLSIGSDAVDLGDATIRNDAGVDADVSLGAHAIENLGDQLVVGTPPMRACTDERTLALGHDAQFGRYGMVAEWNGTPFRVDMVRNFPDFATDADLQELLDPIGRLADQIETQLGYRILEMGDLIDVPAGAPAGWDQEFSRYSQSHLVRERGQIVVFYMNDDNPQDWDGLGGSPMSGHPCCGTITYNKRSLGPLWTGDDPCCQHNANRREGEALVHELFHLLGFKHYFDQHELTGVQMSPGALDRPGTTGSLTYYAAWTDIENLRCIFPEGG